MLLPHIAAPVLLPQAQYRDFPMPKVEPADHYHQFVEAVLGNGKTSTPFDYSGALTEAVLLGPVATRFPKTTLELSLIHIYSSHASQSPLVRTLSRSS